MSQYDLKNNWQAKDAINAPVVGEEFQTEFLAIQEAVNSKSDSLNAALTGVPTAPTPDGDTASQVANVAYVDSEVGVVSTALDNYYTKAESETRYINANSTSTESMAGDLLVNGIRLDHSQNRITGLNSPTANNHAATKAYVDSSIDNFAFADLPGFKHGILNVNGNSNKSVSLGSNIITAIAQQNSLEDFNSGGIGVVWSGSTLTVRNSYGNNVNIVYWAWVS